MMRQPARTQRVHGASGLPLRGGRSRLTGTRAETESITIKSIAPLRTSVSVISRACSPDCGCAINQRVLSELVPELVGAVDGSCRQQG